MVSAALLNMLKSTDPGRYDMNLKELLDIWNGSKNWFDAMDLAFRYGFVKGQRQMKNSMKKKSVEE